ncbi:hypothetical protein [Marinobacter sp.]|uniref:hypothetical protein n=1 Tax=Marinobacter sp. TaxID=50741 RepID=UPI0035C6B656
MKRSRLCETTQARLAAEKYVSGVPIRQQQQQLTDQSLAAKFECSAHTIKRVKANGHVTRLSESDQQLVRQCCREHDRLEAQAIFFTKTYLSKHYGVPICAIDRELERMGFKNPLNRKDKQGRAEA